MFDGLPRKHFAAILVDPPWRFKTYTDPAAYRLRRGAEHHYQTMSAVDLMGLPVRELADPEGCHLFMWATGPHMPQALDVIKAWCFRYSGFAFTWVKLKAIQPPRAAGLDAMFHVGLGYTTRKNAEFCLLARRGNPKRLSRSVRELIVAPIREHSRKPDEVYERIEAYCADPYLELFARSQRRGWTCVGDEANKFTGSNIPKIIRR